MISTILLLAVSGTATITADNIAVDNITRAGLVSGHVKARYGKVTARGDRMERDADGVMKFDESTTVTTCSNEVGHTHWNVSGEVEFREDDYVLVRNAWLTFYEVPVFWLPYMYYPLDTKCGFSWMVGYTGRWGGYLMTKYRYHLLGDAGHADGAWWLSGDTRLDVRTRNGVAFGEDLDWSLGDFGAGKFKLYYAWDEDYDRLGTASRGWKPYNWGSEINRDRYGMSLDHLYELSERDTLKVQGTYYSDSFFRHDFFRRSFFSLRNDFVGYQNSGVFLEHVENSMAVGAEASGRLNDFYGSTERLPEFYLDIMPQPVFALPVNYESDSKLGWLRRRYAAYAAGDRSVFGANPGLWADYDALRFDTYHRLVAPFRAFDDLVSVVPRVGYRGTFWNRGGYDNLSGFGAADSMDASITRSILEGGVTFAARGTGAIDDRWRHMLEPYLDVLAQKAHYDGLRSGSRPYVFDAVDISRCWEDQFAGRGRNLPYSYYGITPGIRNAWSRTDEKGNSREILDFDIYAAAQFNRREWNRAEEGYDDESHGLADPDGPNYGGDHLFVSPGARLRWKPEDDTMLGLRGEYDSDRNRIAVAAVNLRRRVTGDFSYYADYYLSDSRVWDFSSTPYDPELMREDALNWSKHNIGEVGFTYQPIDWFAMNPFIRWDFRDGSLDTTGAWFDYLTDCLGFRFVVEYENSYRRIDGSDYDEDWSFGFQIYLRAFGFDGNSIFGGR